METILQQFLDAGMLSIDNDTTFNSLQAAAQDVAKDLSKERTKLVPAVMVALDAEVAPDEPLVQEVDAAIKKKWATYRTQFRETPVQVVRAVLLESLRIVGEEKVSSAAIVRLTGESYLPFVELGNEAQIVLPWLEQMRDKVEVEAASAWSRASSGATAKKELALTLSTPAISAASVDEKTLSSRFIASAGSTDAQGNALANSNAYSPYNQSQAWATAFGPIAAKGVSEAVNKVQAQLAAQVTQSLSNMAQQLNAQLPELAAQLQAAAQDVAQSSANQERKTALLWWKESLYSPLLQRSYRDLDPAVAALAMAVDLSRQVPAPHPLAVEYFLREAVREALTDHELGQEPQPVGALLQSVTSSTSWEVLQGTTKVKTSSVSGRTSLLRYLSNINNPVDEDVLLQRLGIKPDVTTTPASAALWFFRDLQAEKLVASKA